MRHYFGFISKPANLLSLSVNRYWQEQFRQSLCSRTRELYSESKKKQAKASKTKFLYQSRAQYCRWAPCPSKTQRNLCEKNLWSSSTTWGMSWEGEPCVHKLCFQSSTVLNFFVLRHGWDPDLPAEQVLLCCCKDRMWAEYRTGLAYYYGVCTVQFSLQSSANVGFVPFLCWV